MKAFAILATAALTVLSPVESHARDKRIVIVSGGSRGHCAPQYRPSSYGVGICRPFAHTRTYVTTRSCAPRYYGGYTGYAYAGYYAPSLSFTYTSAPRTVYRSAPVYDVDREDSLEVSVQRELRRRGYYDGDVDGDIGPASRSAIREFQMDRGLAATGRIDSSLLRALGI